MADSDEMHSNDDFAEEKEGENESGFLYPPLKIQQLQREMIEQKHTAKSKSCAFAVPKRSQPNLLSATDLRVTAS